MKKRFTSYVREHRNLFLASGIAVVLLLTIISVLPSLMKSSLVSHTEIKNYFEEYLSEYCRLVEENMGYLDVGSQNLSLYWQRPYHVKGIISNTHGSALILDSSDQEDIEIESFYEPIEHYVWPKMVKDPTGLPTIRILKAERYYHFDSQVNASGALVYVDPGADLIYTGSGHIFEPLEGGAVIIFGSLVEGNRMILKGSNLKEDWSKLQARLDSLSKFAWDCQDMLNDTAIEDIKAKYKLPLLLDRISSRLKTDTYRDNPVLFTEDYEELKTVCESNDTLSGVLMDYYEMQGRTSPTPIDQLLGFLKEYILPIVLGLTIGIILIIYELKVTRTKAQTARRKSSALAIREELQSLRKQISNDLENEDFKSKAYSMDAFQSLKHDLLLGFNNEDFRKIKSAYDIINRLQYSVNPRDVGITKYREAIKAIDSAINLLN